MANNRDGPSDWPGLGFAWESEGFGETPRWCSSLLLSASSMEFHHKPCLEELKWTPIIRLSASQTRHQSHSWNADSLNQLQKLLLNEAHDSEKLFLDYYYFHVYDFFKNLHSAILAWRCRNITGRMSKSEAEEMIEIEIDGQEKQECLEEGWVSCIFCFFCPSSAFNCEDGSLLV